MADRPQLNPYNPAEPFIKMKLEGHFIDRLLNTMEDFHVPFTQALKYFHNEPEGNAGHFLSLLLDDFVPFKYTTEHGGDWKDYAKEALMLAAPAPKGSRHIVPDLAESNKFNARLKQIAAAERNNGQTYVADKLDDWSNRNLTLDDYQTFENWNNPYFYDNVPSLVNDKYINSKLNDVVLTEGDMNNPILDRETAGFVVNKDHTPMRSSHDFVDNGTSGLEYDYVAKPHIIKTIEAYEKQGYGIDKMAQDLVNYYTYDKYPVDMMAKPSNYAFTVGDLEMSRIPGKSDLITDVESLLGNPNEMFGPIDMYARNFGKSYPVVKDIFVRINDALADPSLSRSDKYIAVKSALEELAIEEGLKGI